MDTCSALDGPQEQHSEEKASQVQGGEHCVTLFAQCFQTGKRQRQDRTNDKPASGSQGLLLGTCVTIKEEHEEIYLQR